MIVAPRLAYQAASVLGRVLSIPFVLPSLVFYFVWKDVNARWLEWIPGGLWEPAWPIWRLRIVLLAYALPITGAIMVAGMLVHLGVRFLLQKRRPGTRAHSQYELLQSLEVASDETEEEPATTSWSRAWFGVNIGWCLQFAVCVVVVLAGIHLRQSYVQPSDVRYLPVVQKANKFIQPQGHAEGEKIMIAAMFFNNENIIPYWSDEIIKLIHYLGTDNVFVSIVESNSGDQTPARLREFDERLNSLGVARRILIGDTTIPRPANMDTSTTRIKFLSAVRNRALEPLDNPSVRYDRVIFSNDVYVQAESIVELLRSNFGNWDMVCGTDHSFWGLYDAWVTRDRLGRLVSSLWPYLLEDTGMRAVMKDEPAPVFSCWNGITAFRADLFLPVRLRNNQTLSAEPLSYTLPPSHPASLLPLTSPLYAPPYKFRHSEPGECFSSESFLLPYDMRRVYNMQRIIINPRVITGYDWRHYVWFKYVLRHPWMKYYIETWENGAGMHLAKMIIGNSDNVWQSDGFECQPW